MFSVCLLRVYETIKNWGGGVTVFVSSQHDDKWVAKGQLISASK